MSFFQVFLMAFVLFFAVQYGRRNAKKGLYGSAQISPGLGIGGIALPITITLWGPPREPVSVLAAIGLSFLWVAIGMGFTEYETRNAYGRRFVIPWLVVIGLAFGLGTIAFGWRQGILLAATAVFTALGVGRGANTEEIYRGVNPPSVDQKTWSAAIISATLLLGFSFLLFPVTEMGIENTFLVGISCMAFFWIVMGISRWGAQSGDKSRSRGLR